MVLVVRLVGPSALRAVFVWFPYGGLRFSYCSNRPPRRSIGFRDRFRMVLVLSWFRIVLIVLLVSPSNFEVVLLCCSYGFVMCSYGLNRPPRWFIGFRDRVRMVFIWFCKVFIWF